MNDTEVSVALIAGKLHRLDVKQCTLVSGQLGKVLDLNIRSVMSGAQCKPVQWESMSRGKCMCHSCHQDLVKLCLNTLIKSHFVALYK